jgi:hypothetical protein
MIFPATGLAPRAGDHSDILKVRIGCEADDVHLDGAICISKTAFQTSVELGQQRQDGILIGSKVFDTLPRVFER